MTTVDDLREALATTGILTDSSWLRLAIGLVAAHPSEVEQLFPAVVRRCGHRPLVGVAGWSVDDAARTLLLAALPQDQLASEVDAVYRHGDVAEKLAVLKALPLLPIKDAAVPLLRDALRTNDPRLVAAALGPYATNLDDAAWRQGVLKCVFMGIPLAEVDSLPDRADAELARMLQAVAGERRAAGRPVPLDVLAFGTEA